MDILHHIGFGRDPDIEEAFNRLGISFRKSPLPGGSWVAAFDISESHVHWPAVARIAEAHGLVNITYTVFTTEEVLQAEWLRLDVTFERGYPQPESGWKELVYENGCPRCGVGYIQKASFRLKEPQMGKHSFLSPYWAPIVVATEEVFVTFRQAEVKGYKKCPVINHSTGISFEGISQMYVYEETIAGLRQPDDVEREVCVECGQIRYGFIKRGKMKYIQGSLPSGVDLVRTAEWFGSGHGSFQEILVSHRLAKIIVANKWKGVRLLPINLV